MLRAGAGGRLRTRPPDRPHPAQPPLGRAAHAAPARRRVLHHLIRRKCAERVAERAPARPDRAARRCAVRARPAAVCRLAAHGRPVARAGDRRIRHAAADGHLFPAVHPARGRGLSAPGRFPARPRLPARARLRQAKPDHVLGCKVDAAASPQSAASGTHRSQRCVPFAAVIGNVLPTEIEKRTGAGVRTGKSSTSVYCRAAGQSSAAGESVS